MPSYATPDLQSFPLTMLVSHIIDPHEKSLLKKVSNEILNRNNQPIMVLDPQGQVVVTNQAFKQLHRAGSDAVKNSVCFAELDCADGEIAKILDFGIPITNFRDNLLIDEPTGLPVNVHIYPIFNGSKVRLGAVCLVQDITDEVCYNKLLKQSELILNTINTGVLAVDKSLNITMLNQYAEKCFSIQQRQVIGRPFGEFIGQFTGDRGEWLNELTDQQEIRDLELTFSIGHNKHCYICDTYLLKNELDEADGTLIFFKNITPIKEFEAQLARTQKLSSIGAIAAGMAHEIRNPLTAVRGFVQLIHQKHRQMGINEFDEYEDMMLAEIDRVNTIITDFLNMAKPKQAAIQLLDVNSLLNETMFLVENEGLRQSIAVNLALSPSLPPIAGDKDRLIQVFLNITNNAFQAMAEKGELTIKSTTSADLALVTIDFIDNGQGIPEDKLDKIFDPFFTTKDHGTGLGLAISNKIIIEHGGEIKVNCPAEGGTVFSVILPSTSLTD